jgi:hypothetical protein
MRRLESLEPEALDTLQRVLRGSGLPALRAAVEILQRLHPAPADEAGSSVLRIIVDSDEPATTLDMQATPAALPEPAQDADNNDNNEVS